MSCTGKFASTLGSVIHEIAGQFMFFFVFEAKHNNKTQPICINDTLYIHSNRVGCQQYLIMDAFR